MNTNFYHSGGSTGVLNGDCIATVYFYKDGNILGYVERIEEHCIKEGKIESVYDGDAKTVYFDFPIKRANKLNLNRKDAFYIKNTEKRYFWDEGYNLYIYADLMQFENLGEVLAADHNHEKCYLETYKTTLPKAVFKRCKIERELCENYELKPGEVFGSHYGTSKDAACISIFDTDNSLLPKVRAKHEKGIIRRWFEMETVENHDIILTSHTYSRIEKDDFRQAAEKLSDELKAIRIDLSYYDIQKLNNAGYEIIKKEA